MVGGRSPGRAFSRPAPPDGGSTRVAYVVQTSSEQLYEIFFNHRIAYVRADDVDVVR